MVTRINVYEHDYNLSNSAKKIWIMFIFTIICTALIMHFLETGDIPTEAALPAFIIAVLLPLFIIIFSGIKKNYFGPPRLSEIVFNKSEVDFVTKKGKKIYSVEKFEYSDITECKIELKTDLYRDVLLREMPYVRAKLVISSRNVPYYKIELTDLCIANKERYLAARGTVYQTATEFYALKEKINGLEFNFKDKQGCLNDLKNVFLEIDESGISAHKSSLVQEENDTFKYGLIRFLLFIIMSIIIILISDFIKQ